MSARITELIDKIARLEYQLLEEIKHQEEKFHYRLEGTRVRFEDSVETAHRKLRVALIPWLRSSLLRNILSIPFIYSMIAPLAFIDITISLYQHICFRLYNIPRVKRADYVVIDRHPLSYLNAIEKLNCVYCGYGNGVIAYSREIISRTEQYWCPIKHSRKVVGTHRRYDQFLAFGEGENYQAQVLNFREKLRAESPPAEPGSAK